MRDAMMRAITELAEIDHNVMLLTADLGFSIFEEFEKNFPDQYINVGVAEQNMTGVGAGLALEGKKIFTYSIGNFPTLRCLEQIRNDICYHDLNVNIIGMGGGFSYGSLGMTHHATEDLSILRSLPNMTVIAPSGKEEAYQLVKQAVERPGPSYFRIDKTVANSDAGRIKIGELHQLTDGEDTVIFAIGGIVCEAEKAVNELYKIGIKATIVSVHTLKPINDNQLINLCFGKKCVLTIEENNIYGGLASCVSEILSKNNIHVPFISIGIADCFISEVGSQNYLQTKTGLSSDNIVENIVNMIAGRVGNEKV